LNRLLVPEYIKNLKPYVPGRSIEEIQKQYNIEHIHKLASNENPLGTSPKALEAMQKAFSELHRYPDIGAIALRAKLAEKYNLKIENIAVGNGSEGIMANILRCFLCDNDEMISSEATFIGFQVLARGRGNRYIEVPMPRDTYKFDLNAIVNAITPNTKIIYLCNPNNPTGTIFTRDEFDKFMESVPGNILVILDEAYFEFSAGHVHYPDSLDYRHDNVITLRTFSKAYGLAGARIGYGFAHEELIRNIMKVKLPFEPGNLAQAGALAALDDEDFLQKTLKTNAGGYGYFSAEFTKMGLSWIPSYANFIMIDFHNEEKVNAINSEMLKQGIIVRPLKPFGLPACLRISIGTAEENEQTIKALKTIL
jgi:histidinol-phosphate aminotransferase